jgi:hypothetical protein
MSPQTSHAESSVSTTPTKLRINYFISIILLATSLLTVTVASAHKLEISKDIGGTLHIEPNDNPRAGEPAQAWFALTRKGGQVLPLKECDCRLAVYAEPRSPEAAPLSEPPLKPVQAERYAGIPGTEIMFPQPGIYQLQLTGKPSTAESFQPFELNFTVTVAAGKTVESRQVLATPKAGQPVQNVTENRQANTLSLTQPLVILPAALLSMGVVGLLVKFLRRGDR